MKILPLEHKKNGYLYRQLKRGTKAIIYEQIISDDLSRFEVFWIKVSPERKVNGQVHETKEKFPSNEDFGKTAWSFTTYENALSRFEAIENSIGNTTALR